MCMYAYKRGGGMDRCTDGWMYRWVDGWMDGGTGEWIDVQMLSTDISQRLEFNNTCPCTHTHTHMDTFRKWSRGEFPWRQVFFFFFEVFSTVLLTHN